MPKQSEYGYDLEERTAKFGEDVIIFIKAIKLNDINRSVTG